MRQLLFIVYFSLLTVGLWAQDIPEPMSPKRLVNDYVGMLNATERETLEQKLRAYNDSTSSQITVVIVKTTGDYPIGDYAFELGRRWGVGQKDKDNGLVLLWAPQDRKIFIATGRGLEGAIPDVIAKRIIREVITPEFKAEMYYRGLDRGTDEIIKYASGEYKSDGTEGGDGLSLGVIIFLVIVFIIIIVIFSRSNRGGGGGMRSGGGWIPYTTFSGWGSSSGNWGGGSSGGGSSFGGFGGGDFGGGGAGGDY
ncbi:TPM domain-containing protein [Runella sp.]|uniref:TPM domain-containing protein n=1 Tax=Runella sp. TaxID=1960881 RepID=UPI003D1058FF